MTGRVEAQSPAMAAANNRGLTPDDGARNLLNPSRRSHTTLEIDIRPAPLE